MTHTHTHTHTHTYTHIYTYTHTHPHARTNPHIQTHMRTGANYPLHHTYAQILYPHTPLGQSRSNTHATRSTPRTYLYITLRIHDTHTLLQVCLVVRQYGLSIRLSRKVAACTANKLVGSRSASFCKHTLVDKVSWVIY